MKQKSPRLTKIQKDAALYVRKFIHEIAYSTESTTTIDQYGSACSILAVLRVVTDVVGVPEGNLRKFLREAEAEDVFNTLMETEFCNI